MKKKIFIEAVLEKNLGDDLFLHILLNRYKNTLFYTQTKYKYEKRYNNLKIYSGKKIKYVNAIMNRIFRNGKFCGKLLRNRCDYMVSIGGSIFIEWGSLDKVKRDFSIYNTKKPYYILGANFGPYKTQEFKEYIKTEIVSKAKDVCFRDRYSLKCFSELKNVRYATDIVFSLDISDVDILDSNRVIISVIDCEKKVSNKYKGAYENKIIEMAQYFIDNGYEVVLMSFCKAEKDEKAIESILDGCNENLRKKLKCYYYNGDVNEAINVIADSKIVVGSRFHANIIGLVLGKTVIPIAYSNKTIEVLKDMNFKGKVYNIKNMNEMNVNKLMEEIEKNKLDIENQKVNAIKHFEELDKVLK